MRGIDQQRSNEVFTASPEQLVPAKHPLRAIKVMADGVLSEMDSLFASIYSFAGRPSIPLERLLRAQLLQILYSVRSERMLVEQLQYNMLFRWFVGMDGIEDIWDATTYTKNRERFISGAVAETFFEKVPSQADAAGLLSDEHFSVNGTQIEDWASFKSLKAKGGSDDDRPPPDDPRNPTVDFKGQKRSNETHQSSTDPEARMHKKTNGAQCRVAFLGHALIENRNGLVVGTTVTLATGTAECKAAVELVSRIGYLIQPTTLGVDKGYDTQGLVTQLRELNITPHVAQNNNDRRSATDCRMTRHASYALSQRKRKLVEEVFGWMKTVGVFRKTWHRSTKRIGWLFEFTVAVVNLVRMRTRLVPA